MRTLHEIVETFIQKYNSADMTDGPVRDSLLADVQVLQNEVARTIADRLLDESADEEQAAPYRAAMRMSANIALRSVSGFVETSEPPMVEPLPPPCQHEVDGSRPTYDTFPASYPCAKCFIYFQKPEEVAAFKQHLNQREQQANTLHAMPFTDAEFDAFREKRGWNMATRDEVARLTATALLYKQEMIEAKRQLEEFREYANKLTQRPPSMGHTGRYGARGRVGAVVDESVGPPPAGWPTGR